MANEMRGHFDRAETLGGLCIGFVTMTRRPKRAINQM
jgi:hypothetical protein